MTASLASDAGIRTILARWIRWLRIWRAVRWMVTGISLGLGASLLTSPYTIFSDRFIGSEFLLLAAGITFSTALAFASAGFLLPTDQLKAARYFDRQFGLMDRTSTALEISAHRARYPVNLVEEQFADTMTALRTVPRKEYRALQLSPRVLALPIVLLSLLLLVFRLGESYFETTRQRRAERAVIHEETARIEEIVTKISMEERLSVEQQTALTQALEAGLADLSMAQSRDEAFASLNHTEQAILELAEADPQGMIQSLTSVGQAFQEGDDGAVETFREQLAQGDLRAASSTLQSLAHQELDPKQRATLASQLGSAAESISGSDSALAGELQSAVDALRFGSPEAVRQTIETAAVSLAALAQRQEGAQYAAQIAAELRASQERIAQAGGPGNAESLSSSGGITTDTVAPANSAAGGAAAGSDNTAQNGSTGSGAGRGEGIEALAGGSEAGSAPIGQQNDPGDGGEAAYERIFAQERLGETGSGVDFGLPTRDERGEIIIDTVEQGLGKAGPSSVPYNQVFAEYEAVYRQAIARGEVPVFLRSIVRDYFSSLEP